MAFNALEYLEEGKVDFIRNLSYGDLNRLITCVRESANKVNIINGFLPKLKRAYPRFCFDIIYDMDLYVKDVFDLVNGNLGYKVGYKYLISDKEKIRNILNNTSWGRNFVLKNLTNIIRGYKDNIYVILEYVFNDFDNNMDFIDRIRIYNDMHIRYIFMKYLVLNRPDKFNDVYDDITKYLVGYTYQENEQLSILPDMMDVKDISDLAVTILNSNLDKKLWYTLKEYILSNYKYNDLGALLLGIKDNKQANKVEFAMDADRLFNSSGEYQIHIFHDYSNLISMEILKDFERYLNYFNKDRDDMDYTLYNIFKYGLWDELKEYIDKYLSMSKSADFRFLAKGSTTSCYKIGDYVFKLNKHKWSKEDVICPNLYLILRNLEEHYVRDEAGTVRAGIEVQKYLSRKDIRITPQYLNWFSSELERLGYYTEDTLMGGSKGDNCMLLDSYMDADHPNPDSLPDIFKETPLVIIDRDLIYSVKSRKKREEKRRRLWM